MLEASPPNTRAIQAAAQQLFVSAVSLGQHGANEEGEHDAGLDRSGSLGRHEKDEHAAGLHCACPLQKASDLRRHVSVLLWLDRRCSGFEILLSDSEIHPVKAWSHRS